MDNSSWPTTIFLLLFFANVCVLGASSAQDHLHFLQCLTDQFRLSNLDPSNVVYTPNHPSYASLLHLPTQNLRPQSTTPTTPLLIITPFHELQIQALIYCSKKLGTQIRIRSGSHDFEGLSYTSGVPFVILDTRNFRSISVNTEDKTAWVEVGATLGQLYHTIARHSRTLAFPAGTCPTVGVGGHFSGGGYSMMSRKHAIAADHIIDAKLINADGQILDRSSMGEDLFWAIRGGGGTSFGLVLASKVELVTVPETVTVFNVTRMSEQNATQLVHRWQYVADKIDENLLLRVFVKSVRSPVHGNRTIRASFTSLYLGRVHDLLLIMQEKFPELGLVKEDCIEMSWIESTLYFAYLRNESLDILLSRIPSPAIEVYVKDKSDYVRQPIPVSGLRGIWRFLHEEDENKSELQLSPHGGVLSTYSESETPFFHIEQYQFTPRYTLSFTHCLVLGVKGSIGVNYGTEADNLPPPAKVARFLLDSTVIRRVRVFDADREKLRAFAGTGIAITITIPNDQIPHLTNLTFAQEWVKDILLPHTHATNIVRILVGNEPPSMGKFRQGYDAYILKPLLNFLKATNSPFVINPYPFFASSDDNLDYALFRPTVGVVDENTNLTYTNMLDGQLDAVFSAIKRLGFTDIDIVIGETGWPSRGDIGQTGVDLESAAEYNRKLIQHVTSGIGTPLMPNTTFETYIFALFNEDLKPGPTCERNFGLFDPNLTPVYDLGILKPVANAAKRILHGVSHYTSNCIKYNRRDSTVPLQSLKQFSMRSGRKLSLTGGVLVPPPRAAT
ncbi:UNVERIFIED_CONTAM: Berberine bridge enzyme-like 18 [Sesamum latifolium]|uniref:Berberine bridge enzyme-like 18 n=1 Tax=Sesamum latifolium TaxID=2727402 RepID=A0AAW2T8V6_9LAMI